LSLAEAYIVLSEILDFRFCWRRDIACRFMDHFLSSLPQLQRLTTLIIRFTTF